MKLAKTITLVGVVWGLVAACGSSDKKTNPRASYDGGGESSAGHGSDGHVNAAGQAGISGGTDGGSPEVSAAGNSGGNAAGEGGGTSMSVGGAGDAGAAGASAIDDPTCGALGQGCCKGNQCDDLACLGGVSCSCAKALFGRYILRSDGVVLAEDETAVNKQTAILLASTGTPLTGVTDVLEGSGFGCAVVGTDQTAWCWRTASVGNKYGQLGSGTTDSAGPLFRATQVLTAANAPLTGVVGLSRDSAVSDDACAYTSEGKLYCWGDLTYLTNGGTTLYNPYASLITTDGATPLQGVLQVTVNYSYACAVVKGASAREAWCWGYNYYGQLATGDGKTRQYPTKVLGLSDPSAITAFGSFEYDDAVCALDGGKVRCWGNNSEGQVGNGNVSSTVLAPSLVTLQGGLTALTGVVDVRGDVEDNIRCNVCALLDTGDVMCWGTEFKPYPVSLGTNNVVALGSLDGGYIRSLTSDGVYHGKKENRMPYCGPL